MGPPSGSWISFPHTGHQSQFPTKKFYVDPEIRQPTQKPHHPRVESIRHDGPMPLIHYHFPSSGNSQKARLALAEKGVVFETREIDLGPGASLVLNFKAWSTNFHPSVVRAWSLGISA